MASHCSSEKKHTPDSGLLWPRAGTSSFFCERPDSVCTWLCGSSMSVSITQFCWSIKAEVKWGIRLDCVPVKLYWQKWVPGWLWPTCCNSQAAALGDLPLVPLGLCNFQLLPPVSAQQSLQTHQALQQLLSLEHSFPTSLSGSFPLGFCFMVTTRKPISLSFCHSLFKKNCLFIWTSEQEWKWSKSERSFTCWHTLQIVTMTRTGTSQGQ